MPRGRPKKVIAEKRPRGRPPKVKAVEEPKRLGRPPKVFKLISKNIKLPKALAKVPTSGFSPAFIGDSVLQHNNRLWAHEMALQNMQQQLSNAITQYNRMHGEINQQLKALNNVINTVGAKNAELLKLIEDAGPALQEQNGTAERDDQQ